VILVTSAGTVPAQAARFMPIHAFFLVRLLILRSLRAVCCLRSSFEGLQLATLSPRKSSNSRSVASAIADVLRAMMLSLDHCNALPEYSDIRKILSKILFLAAGSILIGIAYVSERCSLSRATM
jgi:hypothetical protein